MRFAPLAVLLLALTLSMPASADLISKTYEFEKGKTLSLGLQNIDELRVDTVRFTLPATAGGEDARTGGVPHVDVALSNVGEKPRRVGVAIVLFDAYDRIVGVAAGSNQAGSLKAGRQKSFRLIFSDLNLDAYRATKFQISVESRP